MPSPSASERFWTAAFAGATPPDALALAMQEGVIDAAMLAQQGHGWAAAWLNGQQRRARDTSDVRHQPWRVARGTRGQLDPHQLPPRLAACRADDPDAGWAAVFQAFLAQGLDPFGPLSGLLAEQPDGLGAAVAMNVPALVDLLAQQPQRPPAAALDARRAPAVFGARQELPWLHASALGWQDSLLEALLDYGLNPNQTDRLGKTALFYARTERAVRALLARGADPQARDVRGRSVVQEWVQTKASFPDRGHKNLAPLLADPSLRGPAPIAAWASAAPPPSLAPDTSAVVLALAQPTWEPLLGMQGQVERWKEEMPAMREGLHLARMDPGGTWAGSWSPAAWVGMTLLRKTTAGFDHLPALLERDDFLAPQDVTVKGSLTERGLLGLALLARIDPRSLVAPSRNPFSDEKRLSHALLAVVHQRWGRSWFEDPFWRDAMRRTSKALFASYATPLRVSEQVEDGWEQWLFQPRPPLGDGLPSHARLERLWALRAQGVVRLVSKEWGRGMLSETAAATAPLCQSLLLVAVGDAVAFDLSRQDAWIKTPNDAFNRGTAEKAWENFVRGPGLGQPAFRGQGELDAELDAALGMVLRSGQALSPHVVAWVSASRQQRLDTRLPAAAAARSPRL